MVSPQKSTISDSSAPVDDRSFGPMEKRQQDHPSFFPMLLGKRGEKPIPKCWWLRKFQGRDTVVGRNPANHCAILMKFLWNHGKILNAQQLCHLEVDIHLEDLWTTSSATISHSQLPKPRNSHSLQARGTHHSWPRKFGFDAFSPQKKSFEFVNKNTWRTKKISQN